LAHRENKEEETVAIKMQRVKDRQDNLLNRCPNTQSDDATEAKVRRCFLPTRLKKMKNEKTLRLSGTIDHELRRRLHAGVAHRYLHSENEILLDRFPPRKKRGLVETVETMLIKTSSALRWVR
jgi:hypothetical protein